MELHLLKQYKNKEEREASKTTSKVWNGPDIPLDGPWNGTEG